MIANKKTIENMKKYFPMLKQFVARDFKTRYRRSTLGILWSVLNPLGTMLVMTIVFSSFFKQQIENFAVYLMCGQLVYSFFSEASSSAMGSIIGNGNLIQKVYVPKYLLPISSVCTALVNLGTSLIALLIVILVTRTPIYGTIFLMPLPIAYTLIFALGLGLVLVVVATSFRDMMHLYGVILTAWAYLTPIFYPIEMLPKVAQKFVNLNPLTRFAQMLRKLVIYGQYTTVAENAYCICVCSTMLLIGIIVFKRHQNNFIFKL